MERRRETTRVKVAERPAGTTLLAAALGILTLVAVVLLAVPR